MNVLLVSVLILFRVITNNKLFRDVKIFYKKNKNPTKNSVKGLYVYNKNDIIREKNNIGR